MTKTKIGHASRCARTEKPPRSLLLYALSIPGVLLAAKLAIAAPTFTPTVNVTDALLKDGHSKIWKQNPGLDDPDSKYFVAARRSDGTIAIVMRSAGYADPKTVSLMVDFMKCGQLQDFPSSVANAAAFHAALAHPAIDDPRAEGFPIFEGSAIETLYQTLCTKNR